MQRAWKERFEIIKTKVFERAPVLQDILQQYGAESIFSYTQTHQQIMPDAFFADRQQELIGVVAQKTEELFGSLVAKSVQRQLQKHYYVSTADHHGPICHPFFLSANATAALPYMADPQPDMENIIVFSCANVSLNNSSFPRGLFFHSNKGKNVERLSLVPAKYNTQSVLGNAGYNAEDIVRLKKNISEKIHQNRISSAVGEKLFYLVESVYDQSVILGAQNYDQQISMTNLGLWKHFFATTVSHPRLVYISQESIVAQLLCLLLKKGNNVISDIVLHPDYQALVRQYFDGVDGAFSFSEKKGTYLFWGMSSDQKRRQQLWFDGEYLKSADGSFVVAFTPAHITEKLMTGELVPSMLLTFIVLSFYYGLTCLGGFYQPSYMTIMKQSYSRLLAHIGLEEEMYACERVNAKRLGSDFTIAFTEQELSLATGMDLFLYGNQNTWNQLALTAKAVSVQEALDCMMVLFYSVLYSSDERTVDVSQMDGEQIMRGMGLETKIKSCVTIV